MQILSDHQIQQKIKRLAIEILEKNFEEKEIILAGLNNSGYGLAERLLQEMKDVIDIKITLSRLSINPANPIENDISINMDVDALKGKVIIIVDDVANTGRTLFYAFQPLMNFLPKKVEVAVLVDREHKSFPVSCNYVGLSLATTLNENIEVEFKGKEMSMHLN